MRGLWGKRLPAYLACAEAFTTPLSKITLQFICTDDSRRICNKFIKGRDDVRLLPAIKRLGLLAEGFDGFGDVLDFRGVVAALYPLRQELSGLRAKTSCHDQWFSHRGLLSIWGNAIKLPAFPEAGGEAFGEAGHEDAALAGY